MHAMSVCCQVLSGHFPDVAILDGYIVSNARWEGSWDGIHYSVMARNSDFNASSSAHSRTQKSEKQIKESFRRGGHDLCGILNEFPDTHNLCFEETMYWKKRVIARTNLFDAFEGGISRMLTMMWLNMICASSLI